MKAPRIPCASAIVALLFCASVAQSQEAIQNTIGLGPRFGYYRSIDAVEGGWYLGGQARLRFGSFFGVEGTIEYRAAETFEFPTTDGKRYQVDVFYLPVTVSAMAFLPLGSWSPYGFAGFGWYYTNVDYSAAFEEIPGNIFEDQSSGPFGYHFGLGVEFRMGEKAALSFDYRYLFLKSDITGPKDLTSETITTNTDQSNGNVFVLALLLYL
jgi:opacity protein-like surface antigen